MRISSLDHLDANFRNSLNQLLAALQAESIPLQPFETIRSPSRQSDLYQKGRNPSASDYGRTVTRAQAYQSAHQFGLACDLVFRLDTGVWTWDEPHPGQWARLGELAP